MTPDERINRLERLVVKAIYDLSVTDATCRAQQSLLQALVLNHPAPDRLLSDFEKIALYQREMWAQQPVSEEFLLSLERTHARLVDMVRDAMKRGAQ